MQELSKGCVVDAADSNKNCRVPVQVEKMLLQRADTAFAARKSH